MVEVLRQRAEGSSAGEPVFNTCELVGADIQVAARVACADERVETVYDTAKAFLDVLDPDIGRWHEVKDPYVILRFDEAHELTNLEREEELRRALRTVVELPIFTLFLSTAVGKLQQFAPLPSGQSGSSGITSGPIVATSLPGPLAGILDAEWGCVDVSHGASGPSAAGYRAKPLKAGNPEYLTHVQELALIAVRVPFSFRAVSRDSARDEQQLVSGHLRLLLCARDVGFARALVTASACEPLLVLVLGSQELDLGTSGEMLAATVVLDARDCATTASLDHPVPTSAWSGSAEDCLRRDGLSKRRITSVVQFLRALIPGEHHARCLDGLLPTCAVGEGERGTPLKDAFAEGRMYFNHFVKVASFEGVCQEDLLLALTRGAALVCADGQDGFEYRAPVLMGDGERLEKSQVTAIFVQVKSGSGFGARMQTALFGHMNLRLGHPPFFPKGVEKPPPIVRMVFALGAPRKEASVSGRAQPRATESKKSARFTTPIYDVFLGRRDGRLVYSYDIWFAGASSASFGVIQRGPEEECVQTILATMRGQREVVGGVYGYGQVRSEGERAALRGMQPLASMERDHLANWVERLTAVSAGVRAGTRRSVIARTRRPATARTRVTRTVSATARMENGTEQDKVESEGAEGLQGL
ncbi:hypothetical protein C8T65DRAFT_725168 [Cerioporus squamosus]|nr:hypothetical protein C8T65DRAFT_725168 [Cerioporus squamosus]